MRSGWASQLQIQTSGKTEDVQVWFNASVEHRVLLRPLLAHSRSEQPPFRMAAYGGKAEIKRLCLRSLGSLKAISQGDADACACDCVSFHLIARLHPNLARKCSVIGYGPMAPGLPFVTHHLQSEDVVERLRNGVLQAIDDPSLKEVRSQLLLNGAYMLSTRDYAVIDELVQQLDKKNTDSLFPDSHLNFSEGWA